MMSLMTPLMYPCLSERSTALRAGFKHKPRFLSPGRRPKPILPRTKRRPNSKVAMSRQRVQQFSLDPRVQGGTLKIRLRVRGGKPGQGLDGEEGVGRGTAKAAGGGGWGAGT